MQKDSNMTNRELSMELMEVCNILSNMSKERLSNIVWTGQDRLYKTCKIVETTKELLQFLGNNVGITADFPLRITSDDEFTASTLRVMLNNLESQIKEFEKLCD